MPQLKFLPILAGVWSLGLVALAGAQQTASPKTNNQPAGPPPALVRAAFELLGHFHEKPDADRACVNLEQMLKTQALADPSFQERPDRFVILAHGYGHLARGKQERVRLYERFFQKARDTAGRRFMLAALALCADDETPAALTAWQKNEAFRDVWPEIEEIQAALSDQSLKLPRDREPRTPLDLDLLWIDFYVTGDYPPIEKILNVLDRPDVIRTRIQKVIASNPQAGTDLEPVLQTLGMTDPKNPALLSELDLDYLASVRRPGAKGEIADALTSLNEKLGLTREDWTGIVMKGAANWSMSSNSRQHRRLVELLEDQVSTRPPKSQAHIQHWLQPPVEQPQQKRSDKAK